MKAWVFSGILCVAVTVSPDAQRRTGDPVAASAHATNAAAVNAFKELHGSWEVAKATMNGKESRDPALLQGHWRFQDKELLLRSPQKGTVRFALKLDAEARPKAFQLTAVEPAGAGAGWMLFERQTNTLKIAFNDNLEGRPTAFELTKPSEPELIVLILRPQK